MARFESAAAEQEARDFIEEKGITVDLLSTRVDERPWYDVTVANRRGRVIFTDYSPAPSESIYDHEIVFANIVSFVSAAIENEDAEPVWAHQAEVLEAMTGQTIEYLNAIFCTY